MKTLIEKKGDRYVALKQKMKISSRETSVQSIAKIRSIHEAERQFINLNEQANKMMDKIMPEEKRGFGMDKKGDFVMRSPRKSDLLALRWAS